VNQNLVTERIDYINFIQSFAVTLVVIGHSLPRLNGTDTMPLWANIIYDLIYSFHMPLFFVLAGFLLMNSFNRQSQSIQTFKHFIHNKFIRLIIPYVSIGSLAYLLKVFVFNRFAYRPASFDIVFYIKSMIVPGANPMLALWFLPTIFIIYILSYVVLKNDNCIKSNLMLWLILSFFVSLLSNYTHIQLLNISGVLNYLFYFFVGTIIFHLKNSLIKILSNTGFLLFIILLFIEIQMIPISCHNCINFILKYIVAILGIFMSFSIAIYCSNHNHKFLWGLIDGKYYQIYLLAWFFQCGIRIFYQIEAINYITVCFLMFIASFIFPIFITNIIKRHLPKLKIFIGL